MTERASPRIVDFATAAPEAARSKPPADRLLAGHPEQMSRNYFADESGQFFAGIWESTPGRWRVRYSENEFCHLLRGKVIIEDALGERWTFAAGNSFVVPAGFIGTWEVVEPTAKLYAVFESATK